MTSLPVQLYSLGTPNGQKISVALEELKIPYECHRVDILKEEQFKPDFIEKNPNNKIPVIVDPQGLMAMPTPYLNRELFFYILLKRMVNCLEKTATERSTIIQWLFWQMGGVGPMFGQLGHFYRYAKDQCQDPYPLDRYRNETKRLLGVLDKQLEKTGKYLASQDLSVADCATVPWVVCLEKFYHAGEMLQLDSYSQVQRWLKLCLGHESFKKGMEVLAV